MRLYLSSLRTGADPDQIVALAGGARRTALIPNALDGLSARAREASLRRDVDDLGAAGLDVTIVNLREPGMVSRLADHDIVWIRGGNVFVLRRVLADAAADKLLVDLVRRDAVVYGGYTTGGRPSPPRIP
ncbi:Type 1 glutamine amidotransferase-like domain-containing protein [Micromonospora sp. NPDC049559]|uniref:Type 1 glutamine amidotransferase-like domain-containing protein n=1 Tax=Micromonospora sp. NPDC049559 TaxID=3155923 RepID=UPI00344A9C4C